MEKILNQIELWLKEAKEEYDEAYYVHDESISQGKIEILMKVRALIQQYVSRQTDLSNGKPICAFDNGDGVLRCSITGKPIGTDTVSRPTLILLGD